MKSFDVVKRKLKTDRECSKCASEGSSIRIDSVGLDTGLCARGVNCKQRFIEIVVVELKQKCDDNDSLAQQNRLLIHQNEVLRLKMFENQTLKEQLRQREAENIALKERITYLEKEKICVINNNHYSTTNITNISIGKEVLDLIPSGGSLECLSDFFYSKCVTGSDEQKALAKYWESTNLSDKAIFCNNMVVVLERENESKKNEYINAKRAIECIKEFLRRNAVKK